MNERRERKWSVGNGKGEENKKQRAEKKRAKENSKIINGDEKSRGGIDLRGGKNPKKKNEKNIKIKKKTKRNTDA